MTAKALMIQGTTSNSGKSTLVTALCRSLVRRGIRTAPFKPQNMALNSAVTIDGGEIGRAQALQARACGIEPHTDMNPVLLKPTTTTGAQVIIQGKVHSNMGAAAFHKFKPEALSYVIDSYKRLSGCYEAVIVEGAGSPAEINLREGDIANMGFAEAVDCPVILVADIEPGGVFAHVVGTLALLSDSERARIKGIIINRFRGDISLLQSGLTWLENETGKKVLGVLPYLDGLHLEAEDSMSRQTVQPLSQCEKLKVVVPSTPRMSNHTDFDPLVLHPQVDFQFLEEWQPSCRADLIILPGSKNVKADLEWLEKKGFVQAIAQHVRYGGKLIGICGGFQMLGKRLYDPHGIESKEACFDGFGFLDMETTFQSEKRLTRITGHLLLAGGENELVSGYEIHMGTSQGQALKKPFLQIDSDFDGAISDDNRIIGTYIHGLFDKEGSCAALLRWAGLPRVEAFDFKALCDENIDRLTDAFDQSLDIDYIYSLLDIENKSCV